MALHPNRLIVSVSTQTDGQLVALLQNGNFDTSFGVNGTVATGLVSTGTNPFVSSREGESPIRAYIETGSSKIVVAGRVPGIGDDPTSATWRRRAIQVRKFLPSGSLDPSFQVYQVGPNCPSGVDCPHREGGFSRFPRIHPVELPGGGVLIYFFTDFALGFIYSAFNTVDQYGTPVLEWQRASPIPENLNFAAVENNGNNLVLGLGSVGGQSMMGFYYRAYDEPATYDNSPVIPVETRFPNVQLSRFNARQAALMDDNRIVVAAIRNDTMTLFRVLP